MSRVRLVILLTASHALVAAAAWIYFTQPSPLLRPGAPVDVSTLRPHGPVSRTTKPAATNSLAAAPTVVYRTNRFHWNQVESADYRKYIANLRAIGCPEQTIKDLIITDIMKHYAERRGQLKDNGRPFRYWETNEKRTLTAKQLAEREKDLAKIDKQIPAVLRELLGVNYERELNRYFLDTHEDDKRLAFLNDSKRGQVLVVRDMVEEMREHLMEQFADGKPTPAQAEKLKAINELHAGLLAQSLSPAEAEQYELTTSETAERLRTQLVGFEPTEDEFRFMFKLWRDYDGRFAYAGPEVLAQKEAEQRQIEAQIKAKLGDARAAEYERTQNAAYRDLIMFTQMHELPGTTAQAIFEMRQAAQEVRVQLLANRQLKSEQREAALNALQQEVENTIRQALGDKVYGAFTQNAGAWVNSLGVVRER